MKRIKIKQILAVMLALTLCFSINAEPVNAAKKKSKVKVSSVVVKSPVGSKKTAYVAKGKKITLTTTVKATPNKNVNKKVKYKSANKKIATVSKKGVVKGKKIGTTKITVTSTKNTKKKKTIKIKVVSPVTKVMLNESKVSIPVNVTRQLKATVEAPKKSFKNVKWSSSNTKVATVSESGLVKAVAEGDTKITVIALDGSGKKAECTISVGNGIKSIDVYNPNKMSESCVFKVTLDAPIVLTKNNFSVAKRVGNRGNYNKKLEVINIFTTDNINYTIFTNDYVYAGEYVQISIPLLKGTRMLEKRFISDSYAENTCVTAKVGDSVDNYIGFDNALGYVDTKVVSGSLPKGLSISPNDNRYITGIAKAIADNQKVTLAATDEMGRRFTTTVNFLIGDKNTIVAEKAIIGDNVNNVIYPYSSSFRGNVNVVGGSGKYKASLIDDCNGVFRLAYEGMTITKNATIVCNEMQLAPGKYTVKVQFTDEEDETRTAIGTLTVIVSNAIQVTVTMKNFSLYDKVKFYNHDKNSVIMLYDDHDNNELTENMTTYDEVNKVYTAKIYLPAGNYSIYIDSYGQQIVLDRYVNIVSTKNLSYTIPARADITGNIYDANGNLYEKQGNIRIYNDPKATEYSYLHSVSYYSGKYKFEDVPNGTYYVRVYRDNELIGSTTIAVNGKDISEDIILSITNLTE